MTTTAPLPDLQRWRPAVALWMELAEQQPHLAISPTTTAWYGFFRHHRDVLADAGVVIRLTSRNWLADPVRFAASVQAIKCGLPLQRVEARRRRTTRGATRRLRDEPRAAT